jgi:flagellar L-ring protein precursor FlgH
MIRDFIMKINLVGMLLVAVLITGCSHTPDRMSKFEYEPAYPTNIPKADTPRNGSLYQAGAMDLFNDIKARRIGDIITVKLQEKMDAKKKAASTAKKTNATNFGAPSLLGGTVGLAAGGVNFLGATKMDSTNDFKGQGDASQSNSLTGDISVTVVEVIPNGNLVVRGEKWVTINQGEEVIRFGGIVRPADISPDNSIASGKVADARIIYSGDGLVGEATQQGWLARFFSNYMPW